MKLAYDVIEDAYDDTTQIRTMTEQARAPGGVWLVRTTVYAPPHQHERDGGPPEKEKQVVVQAPPLMAASGRWRP
jgi:hypothetical protein